MSRAAPSSRGPRAALLAVVLAQVVALAVRWPVYVEELNPDAISYLRIAEYIAGGQWGLVVTGYWSPLLSWLVAPAIALGASPIPAMKGALAGAAIGFSLATWALACRLHGEGWLAVAAAALAACVAVPAAYSVNPDLLSAVPLQLSLAVMVSASWPERRGGALGAGAGLGVAYLAKAVMLPISVVLIPLWGVLWAWSGRTAPRQAARAVGWTALGLVLVAGPWVVTLSADHGAPTFSTTGPIAHGLMGPPDLVPLTPLPDGMRTQHVLLRQYHAPEPGRIVALEDPRHLPYHRWSPAESSAHLRHQGRIVLENVGRTVQNVRVIDRFGVSLVGLLAVALALAVPSLRRRLRAAWWWWPSVPALGLLVIYLPVYAGGTRYLYPAVGLLLPVVLCGLAALPGRAVRWGLGALVVLSFLLPAMREGRRGFGPRERAEGELARALADRLAAEALVGPVASAVTSGDFGAAGLGMAVAYRLGVPFYGNEYAPEPERLVESGVRLVVVAPESTSADALAAVPGARRVSVGRYALGEAGRDLRRRVQIDLVVLPERAVSRDEAQRIFDRGR